MNHEFETLKIKGLKKTYRFMHISDCHIYARSADNDEVDAKQTESCLEKRSWQATDKTPAEEFSAALALADKENVDALMITGDAMDFYSPGNLQFIKNEIAGIRTEVLYAFGNHEDGHYSRKLKKEDCYPSLAPLMMGTPDFWVRDYGDLLVIGMDDSSHSFTDEQIEKLRKECERGIPVLLMIHVPVIADGVEGPAKKQWGENAVEYFFLGEGDQNKYPQTKAFVDFVNDSTTPIKAIIAGHVHIANVSTLPGGRPQYLAAPTGTAYARFLTVEPEEV
ncbi:MAG: metallophosphoesterase [Clostridia bacterium]|nr:metallophosphoesterase [Clostridia bacterium]